MLDPPESATIGLFRLINRYLAEPTQQGGQRPAQQALRAVGAGISENRNTDRNEARPHCRDAAVVRGRDDRCDHGRDGLAATFGARLLAGWSARSLDLILCLNGLKGRVYRIKDGKASPATAADRRNTGGVF
jgi:hypothetical protein